MALLLEEETEEKEKEEGKEGQKEGKQRFVCDVCVAAQQQLTYG